jgi:hypothetical protein
MARLKIVVSPVRVRVSPSRGPNPAWLRNFLFCGATPTRTSCTTRRCRDVRGMSRKRRTRLRRRDLGRLRRVDDRRESVPNVPPSPFGVLFLEAPRGLVDRVSARRPTPKLRWRAARAVSRRRQYESSVVAPVCGVSPRHQARRGNWRSHGDRLTPERASRAPRPRTPGHRPPRACRARRTRRPLCVRSERLSLGHTSLACTGRAIGLAAGGRAPPASY